jgi:hypothetical protein
MAVEKSHARAFYEAEALREIKSHYLTDLPDPETLRQEIVTTQHALETRAAMKGSRPRGGKT